jgi:ABC-type multidrug transport system fused ATPase/permease subunit
MSGEAVQTPLYRQTFARLMRFLWPYRVSLGVSAVLAVGSQGAALALVWLTGSVVSAFPSPHHPGSRHELKVIVGIVLAVGAARALMMLGRRLISGRQALGVELDMRRAVYAKLVRLSFRFFDQHQTGQLMSRATVDLQSVRFFLGYGLIFFAQHAFTILGVGIFVFILSWKLALITIAICPVLVAVAYRYSQVSHPVLRDVQQKLADVATVAEENIVGVHVVKSFAQEQA